MQPIRSGGSFFSDGFWGSVGTVAAYLFGMALLQYILTIIGGFAGILSDDVARLLVQAVAVAVPLFGTLLYIDWRWGWQADHIGLSRSAQAVAWIAGGLAIGAVAALLSGVAGSFLAGTELDLKLSPLDLSSAVGLLWIGLLSFGVELIFRGAVTSRYQGDLTRREVLLAATLTPIAWQILQRFLGYPMPWTGLGPAPGFPAAYGPGSGLWLYVMSVALTLAFLRSDSVWFTAGVRFGTTALLFLMPMGLGGEIGSLVVWGIIALALLATEWTHLQQAPRRGPTTRGQPARGTRPSRGRTVRGPWGPH